MYKKADIKKFKELEKKLFKLLKNNAIDFSENDSEEKVKQRIKQHIEVLKDVKVLFDEYEKLAKKIQDYNDDDDTHLTLEVSEKIINVPQNNLKISDLINHENKNIKKNKKSKQKDVDLSTDFLK